jgi:hypothetical protein
MQVKNNKKKVVVKWGGRTLTLLSFQCPLVSSLSSPLSFCLSFSLVFPISFFLFRFSSLSLSSLLLPVLELEHPDDYLKAREAINAATSPPNDDNDDNDEEGEEEKNEEGKQEPPTTTKPKPVVFDIGGRRFRVDTLQNVADALVVACTGTGTGADRLPYTRRELLVRVAMRLWSPYAEAILQEVDDRSASGKMDLRLVEVALSCVNGVFVALTALDAGDVLFRAMVGLRVSLLHEMGAEACWEGTCFNEEAGRRMRSAVQCARQT